jgi:putative ABC transport system permease protein
MIKREIATDIASQHRGAGVFALAFAAAAMTVLAGVFAIDSGGFRLSLVFPFDRLPDAFWPANWLPGMVTGAEQQEAAAQQWLRVVLIFAAITSAIACINALIGFASHANERRFETALRGLVGASPRQLRRSLLKDALVNALLGAGLGIVAGTIGALALRRLGSAQAGLEPGWLLLAFSLSMAIAAFAARSAGRRFGRAGWLGDALAPESRSIPGFGAEDLRALLTGAQLACAVALTIVSVLVWSYASAHSAAPKAIANRYVASVTATEQQTAETVRNDLRAAGVEAESIATPGALLGIGKVDKVISMCGHCSRANMYTPLFPLETQQHVVGSGFFRVAGIRIERGREFDDGEDEARTIVVNRTFAQQAFMTPNAVGKRIMVGGAVKGVWYDVIGVVDDVPTTGLRHLSPDPAAMPGQVPANSPAIYFSASTHPPSHFDVIIIKPAQSTLNVAGLSFEPLARLFARANEPQRSYARVLTALGLLLCAAAAVGTFSTTLLSVRARRIEIAIRRSVGARRSDVRRLVIGRVVLIALRGIVFGVIISIGLSRALEVFVPGLPLLDPEMTLVVMAAFLSLALLASLLPLRAALRISPAGTRD